MSEKKVKTDIEGPAGYNGGKGPGDALSMPTKTYPASSKLPEGKKTQIEGPCSAKEGYHK